MRGNICPATSVASAPRDKFAVAEALLEDFDGCEKDCKEAGQKSYEKREEALGRQGGKSCEEAGQEVGG
jgi:hypothetical protein